MLRAGSILLGVACALILAMMFGTHSGWIVFGPCGPDLIGYCLLGGAFLAIASGLLLILIGLVASGIRRARKHLAT